MIDWCWLEAFGMFLGEALIFAGGIYILAAIVVMLEPLGRRFKAWAPRAGDGLAIALVGVISLAGVIMFLALIFMVVAANHDRICPRHKFFSASTSR
jgi:hypothetical protein